MEMPQKIQIQTEQRNTLHIQTTENISHDSLQHNENKYRKADAS